MIPQPSQHQDREYSQRPHCSCLCDSSCYFKQSIRCTKVQVKVSPVKTISTEGSQPEEHSIATFLVAEDTSKQYFEVKQRHLNSDVVSATLEAITGGLQQSKKHKDPVFCQSVETSCADQLITNQYPDEPMLGCSMHFLLTVQKVA